MIQTLALLLSCQLAGEIASRLGDLPVPGPVLGMLLLLGILVIRRGVPENVEKTTTGLLEHLSLMFVPAGVGVMLHLDRIGTEWLPITGALVGSTAIGVVVTAGLFALGLKLSRNRMAGQDASEAGKAGGEGGE